MKARRRILLYGNSVILGTVGASLRSCSQFEVTTLAPPLQEAMALYKEKPDVLFFDLEAPRMEAVFSLLKADPALLLIGVSSGINLVNVWSGRQLRELSTQGLLDLIKSAADDLPNDPEVGEDGPCSGGRSPF
ncbi:MAG: hypothetical protein WCA08_08090 [Desulfoferrobacter sp.]